MRNYHKTIFGAALTASLAVVANSGEPTNYMTTAVMDGTGTDPLANLNNGSFDGMYRIWSLNTGATYI